MHNFDERHVVTLFSNSHQKKQISGQRPYSMVYQRQTPV